MSDDVDLRALVARARQADPDAWEALHRRAYPRLFAYARRRLATEEQAEDAVSETMTRAMWRITEFTWSGAGVDGWLFGIARNVVYEFYRDSARTRPTDTYRTGIPAATPGPTPSTSHAAQAGTSGSVTGRAGPPDPPPTSSCSRAARTTCAMRIRCTGGLEITFTVA